MRCAPYTSSTKSESACRRWTRPRSSATQSAAGTGRGTRQNGKIFSVPRASAYTEKVTPLWSRVRSATESMRASSSGPLDVSADSAVRQLACMPAAPISSSYVFGNGM
jgi:hypothetical protein